MSPSRRHRLSWSWAVSVGVGCPHSAQQRQHQFSCHAGRRGEGGSGRDRLSWEREKDSTQSRKGRRSSNRRRCSPSVLLQSHRRQACVRSSESCCDPFPVQLRSFLPPFCLACAAQERARRRRGRQEVAAAAAACAAAHLRHIPQHHHPHHPDVVESASEPPVDVSVSPCSLSVALSRSTESVSPSTRACACAQISQGSSTSSSGTVSACTGCLSFYDVRDPPVLFLSPSLPGVSGWCCWWPPKKAPLAGRGLAAPQPPTLDSTLSNSLEAGPVQRKDTTVG